MDGEGSDSRARTRLGGEADEGAGGEVGVGELLLGRHEPGRPLPRRLRRRPARARAQEDLGTEHREVGVLLAPSRRILASFPSTFPPFLHEPPRHERERRD